MCSWLSRRQAPVQAYLRPGIWCPILNLLHSDSEEWQVKGYTPDQCYDKVLAGIQQLENYEKIEIAEENKDHLFMGLYFFTDTCEWLDIVELDFQPGPETGTVVKARSFSSGFCPAWIPLAFIFNMLLCFVPFYDWGQNKKRLERIRRFAGICSSADLPFMSA